LGQPLLLLLEVPDDLFLAAVLCPCGRKAARLALPLALLLGAALLQLLLEVPDLVPVVFEGLLLLRQSGCHLFVLLL
jgi:hypothetical protein